MIGRGIFGNPWLFANCHNNRRRGTIYCAPTTNAAVIQKLRVLVEHTKLFEKIFKNKKSFNIMKKHFKAYVNGFDGAKELRIKLMTAQNASDLEAIISENTSTLKKN